MANISATGYVHNMLDKNMDFKQFVWNCARGMGALIMMRDDPTDAPIDFNKICKPSDYHQKSFTEAQNEIDRLTSMSYKDRKDYGLERRSKLIEYYKSKINEISPEYEKISSMLVKVQAWEPPTKDHENLKKFMIEQLSMSMDGKSLNDYYYKEIIKIKNKGAYEFWANDLELARSNVIYHSKKHEEEIIRSNEIRNWIQALIDSVGRPG